MNGKSRGLAIAAVAITVVGCAAGGSSGLPAGSAISTAIPLTTKLPVAITHDDAMRLFEYDHSLPFDVVEQPATTTVGATIHAFSYLDTSGKRALATLVLPAGKGPFGAVLFLPGALEGREEFQADAIELAGHGVASLLVDTPELYAMPATDREAVAEIVFEMRELRRLLDWLASRPEVDPARLGLFGFSFGAVRAATFAGAEGSHLKIAVLRSTPPSYGYSPMAPFDPIAWVPYASPCALYIQEGAQDSWFTHDQAESLAAAARDPKRLVWYDAGHGLNGQADTDYKDWLIASLGQP
jgi:dienelactone hydrolase